MCVCPLRVLAMIYFSNTFVTVLLVVLCSLASVDLYRQYLFKYHDILFYEYSMGMQTIKELWKIGYRAENVDLKLLYENNHLNEVQKSMSLFPSIPLRGSRGDFTKRRIIRNILERHTEVNLNQTVEIWCDDINQQVRIGANDFRTDSRDACLLYSGDSSTVIQGPETMFEVVDLGDQSFGLKSITNGQYVQVIPPGSGDSFDPWKISLGGYIPGASERFRLSPDGRIFSGLMGDPSSPSSPLAKCLTYGRRVCHLLSKHSSLR
jgi:hypothetical protein